MKMAHKISSKRRNSNPLKRGFDFIFLNDLQSICLNPQQIQYHADTSQGGRERMYCRENKIQRVLSKKKVATRPVATLLWLPKRKATSDCARHLHHHDYRDLPSVWLHSQLAYVLRIVFHSKRRWLFVPRFRNPSQRSQNRATDR